MNNDKSLSAAQNSILAGKSSSMGITSRKKFDNVQKLSSIISKIEQETNRQAHPQQILQSLKQKIKTTYSTLYKNYQQNKTTIIKNIQQTETNDANQNTMKMKMEAVLKEKGKYDRLRVEVEAKQKKLRKVIEIRDRIGQGAGEIGQMRGNLEDRAQIVKMLAEHLGVLEYQTAVLADMKKQRVSIKLNLKQWHDTMQSEEEIKIQRIKKIRDANYTKKILLSHIQQKIKQEDICLIPQSLAEQLSKKLQQYQGKYTQQSIISHQKKMSQLKAEQEYQQLQAQKQLIKKLKSAKQNEQKKEFEIAYNHYLIKQAEEEQIKRLCRVEAIPELTDGSLEGERENLEQMQRDIQRQINELEQKNQKIRDDIESIMTTFQNNKEQSSFLQLQKQLQQQQAQLRRIRTHAQKKQSQLIQWQSILQQMLGGNCTRQNMIPKAKVLLEKYYKVQKMQPCHRSQQTHQKQSNVGTTCQTRQLKSSLRNYQNTMGTNSSLNNKKFTKIQKSTHNQSSSVGEEDV